MDTAVYLREVVTVLSQDVGIRSFQDMRKIEEAEHYISSEFNSFGYHITRQPFYFFGNTYNNLIAERIGASSPEKVLVVGAHYDTVRGTPGADDNASGVAGMLALARILAGKRLARTVRFAAFALEESPVYRTESMGSYHYARSLKAKDEDVEGMICLEMIGFFSDQKNSQRYPLPLMRLKYPMIGNFISMVGNTGSRSFLRGIASAFRHAVDLPLVTLNAPSIVLGIDFSDHWSFSKFGYKAFMVTDTAFYRNPHYHEPTDLPGTLDYGRAAQVVEGLAYAVAALGMQER
jgi:Zn-dependent M28 family amino/carboxypeptidase